jgi:hypothetical protein
MNIISISLIKRIYNKMIGRSWPNNRLKIKQNLKNIKELKFYKLTNMSHITYEYIERL